jgi:L-amino acid N-acyltransferase YncA
MLVRDATAADAAACAAIYAHYVRDTAISFELEPPSPAEMASRIAAAQERHAFLVAEDDGTILGYAYGGDFHRRPAYARTAEVSVYLDHTAVGRGAGRALYTELIPRLTDRGFVSLIALLALPNAASQGLHRAFGFTSVGTLRRVGHKLDAWHDVEYFQLEL